LVALEYFYLIRSEEFERALPCGIPPSVFLRLTSVMKKIDFQQMRAYFFDF